MTEKAKRYNWTEIEKLVKKGLPPREIAKKKCCKEQGLTIKQISNKITHSKWLIQNGSNLSVRDNKFCDLYVKYKFNGSKAAIESGFTKKNARNIVSEKLTKPDIWNRINEILNEIFYNELPQVRHEFQTVAREINDASILDFLEIDKKGNCKLKDLSKAKNIRGISSFEVFIQENGQQNIKIRLHSKDNSGRLLEKIDKMYRRQKELELLKDDENLRKCLTDFKEKVVKTDRLTMWDLNKLFIDLIDIVQGDWLKFIRVKDFVITMKDIIRDGTTIEYNRHNILTIGQFDKLLNAFVEVMQLELSDNPELFSRMRKTWQVKLEEVFSNVLEEDKSQLVG